MVSDDDYHAENWGAGLVSCSQQNMGSHLSCDPYVIAQT
jgi:hypothetical protein